MMEVEVGDRPSTSLIVRLQSFVITDTKRPLDQPLILQHRRASNLGASK
jgi:hypothetical protein